MITYDSNWNESINNKKCCAVKRWTSILDDRNGTQTPKYRIIIIWNVFFGDITIKYLYKFWTKSSAICGARKLQTLDYLDQRMNNNWFNSHLIMNSILPTIYGLFAHHKQWIPTVDGSVIANRFPISTGNE